MCEFIVPFIVLHSNCFWLVENIIKVCLSEYEVLRKINLGWFLGKIWRGCWHHLNQGRPSEHLNFELLSKK